MNTDVAQATEPIFEEIEGLEEHLEAADEHLTTASLHIEQLFGTGTVDDDVLREVLCYFWAVKIAIDTAGDQLDTAFITLPTGDEDDVTPPSPTATDTQAHADPPTPSPAQIPPAPQPPAPSPE